MPRHPQNPDKAQVRLAKLARLANLGRRSELRAQFYEMHEEFHGTRQAFDQKLKAFGAMTSRPVFSDGRPIGTKGYHLLLELKHENTQTSEWIPKIISRLVDNRQTLSVAEALEWLLSPDPLP